LLEVSTVDQYGRGIGVRLFLEMTGIIERFIESMQSTDLNGDDLSGNDLSGDDFSGADLTSADLTSVDLSSDELTSHDCHRHASPSCPAPNDRWRLPTRVVILFLIILMCTNRSPAYSVLTHEEIVDLLWLDEIRPLLLKRYPGLTDDQIKEAHAYAYGGAVIQDLGYYPFGSAEFSDLAHYVRSGDFVRELLRESNDVNEYAFALGALAHYSSDITGHPAVNQSVAIEYPKLRAKYGKSVTYAEDKTAHLKTEFGFDMVQVAKNRYASQQYHDFIGFQVSKPLLERAFPVVYGLQMKDVVPHEDLAVGSYRFAVSRLIPEMTQVALKTHEKDMMREQPDFAKKKFLYHLSRSDYEREWGKSYAKPGFGARILAVFFRFIPKIGPFKGLGFKNPTAQTEDLYFKSINATVDQYRTFLHEVGTDSLQLTNCDLDDGRVTQEGEYPLADDTYTKLLQQLSARKFEGMSPELRANILDFYSNPSAAIGAGSISAEKTDKEKIDAKKIDAKKESGDPKNIQTELDQLKGMSPTSTVVEKTTVEKPRPDQISGTQRIATCSSGQ
jgi:Zinc dependent phospholipase C